MKIVNAIKWMLIWILFVSAVLPIYSQSTGEKKPDPKTLSWKTTLVSASEPGEPLIVSGAIFQKDGKTPIPNALLYVYHADAGGLYAPKGSPEGFIRIKGWMKTNNEGKYEFRTIKPGSYPNTRGAAHIHAKVVLPGGNERWIDEFLFDNDPNLKDSDRKKHEKDGIFSPIVKIEKRSDRVLHCARYIIMK